MQKFQEICKFLKNLKFRKFYFVTVFQAFILEIFFFHNMNCQMYLDNKRYSDTSLSSELIFSCGRR